MEPGRELRELEQAILRQDANLETPAQKRTVPPPRPSEPEQQPPAEQAPPREIRKSVTILFCDVVGSTALGESTDPEALRALLLRYFERTKTVIERYGGTVEKFIGDAVMAVFGVPVAHEDDALRACRAALAIREGFPELGIEGRVGITTGEVVAGTRERLATGDPVNVAARLQQTAEPGEVLIGEPTLNLVRQAADVEALEPLVLKGKSAPVNAFRLLAVHEVPQGDEMRFVGRKDELVAIETAWRRALSERRCELFTIVGEAGVGKSRLVAEALSSIEARVVQGRCLPYGEGITYWPVGEVIRQLDALPSDSAAAASIRSLLGQAEQGTSAEEIAWAFRKLLEEQAPLVCLFDDIQWAEKTFLDLIEHAALLSTGEPILLLCLARSELTERHPEWSVGLRLEPLPRRDVDGLIPRRLKADLRQRIKRAAGGNPLFVSVMVEMVLQNNGEGTALPSEDPDGDVSVPPTIQALLTARLDQLDPAEQAALQCAAVEGHIFHRGALQALAPEESQVGTRLAALVRKGLVHPDRSRLAGEDAYRFRHLLLRDAAYETLPKAVRAELHERFGDWLGRHTAELVEPDEILGYHFEQAFRYRTELWPRDDRSRGLGLRASDLLAAAGARALGRDDVGAALNLLRRALGVRPDDDPAVALRLDLTQALFVSGEFAAAEELANESAARAAAAGDQAGELRARLAAARIAVQMPGEAAGGNEPSAALLALAEDAKPVFARVGDEVGLTEAWLATAWAQLVRCRWAAMLDATEHALVHARRAGYARWERELPVWKGTALFYGPTPVGEVLQWYEDVQESQHSLAVNQRAVLEAMRGRFDEARALLAKADAGAAEREETVWRGLGWMAEWEIESLAGDPSAAEIAARKACELLGQLGETGFRSLAAGQLASSLYALGRLGEAERWTETAEALASSDDVISNMLWRQVRAKLLARAGKHADAQRLAREAVQLGEGTDMLNWQGSALADLGVVLVLDERLDDARARFEQALALFDYKGNLASAALARSALAKFDVNSQVVTDRRGD
jgi:class 3 adenylate cyclase/tetratricopeptide (TPR) repeat protein